MSKLYLASSSPRRAELLQQIGVEFEVFSSPIDETPLSNEPPTDYVRRMAEEKAKSAYKKYSEEVGGNSSVPVFLAADTSVILQGTILGKPTDQADHLKMLEMLSGQTHQVITGFAIHSSKHGLISRTVVTDVTFKSLTKPQIESYWLTGEPQDKAGGYGIQGYGAIFVDSIHGSYSNVVGLPLTEVSELLTQFGIQVWSA